MKKDYKRQLEAAALALRFMVRNLATSSAIDPALVIVNSILKDTGFELVRREGNHASQSSQPPASSR
jgi:hypothetical protein